MAVTARLYGQAPLHAFSKKIDYLNDDITVTLHTVTYVPDQDNNDFADDLTNEVSGTGYTAGGKSLASKTLTYTSATNTTTADAADLQWTGSSFSARSAAIKDNSPGTAATKPLIAYQLSDADITASGGNFDLVWNAAGIFSFTVT